jgi:hypothetical protein
MARASTLDLEKKADTLARELKKLEDPDTGKAKEKALVNLVHGAIRASWAVSPTKLAYHGMGIVADTDATPRKWKVKCEMCGNWHNQDDVEIDHISGNHSFTSVEEFDSYFYNILDVEFKDLQRLCKYKCHRIKSHMEKQKLPNMEAACIDKIVIFLVKFMETAELTKFLVEVGIAPEKTAKKRRLQLHNWVINLGLSYEESSVFFETCDYLMRLQKKSKKVKHNQRDMFQKVAWQEFWNRVGHTPKTKLTVI